MTVSYSIFPGVSDLLLEVFPWAPLSIQCIQANASGYIVYKITGIVSSSVLVLLIMAKSESVKGIWLNGESVTLYYRKASDYRSSVPLRPDCGLSR